MHEEGTTKSFFGRKAKKFLILIALEIILAILILLIANMF
jgi:hypothetical protein